MSFTLLLAAVIIGIGCAPESFGKTIAKIVRSFEQNRYGGRK